MSISDLAGTMIGHRAGSFRRCIRGGKLSDVDLRIMSTSNSHGFQRILRPGSPRTFVCKACGAPLEVVVHFNGSIVWPVEPGNPEFGEEQPFLRGETRKVSVVCTADIFHSSGYRVVDGVLAEARDNRSGASTDPSREY